MKKNRWQLWLGIVVSVAMLALALLGIDPRRVVATLAGARYIYLIPALASSVAYMLARAFRWRVLLGSEAGLVRCFWATTIGYLVSNVLPFRLGDPARAVAIGLGGKVKISAALSTVIVELVLDMLMVVSLLAISLPFVEQAGLLQSVGISAGGVAVTMIVVLVIFAVRPDWVRRVAQWLLARLPRRDSKLGEWLLFLLSRRGKWLLLYLPCLRPERWLGILDSLLDGLAALRSPRRFVALLGWSVAAWGLVVGYYWLMLQAFLDQVPLVQASLLTCAIGLGMALPSAPGAIGVFHSAAEYALHLSFGIPKEEAFGIAFAAHASQYTFSCLLGMIGLARLGLSFRQLRADAAVAAAAAEDE
jgi:uncharacterized protein (TIRG00374 family)